MATVIGVDLGSHTVKLAVMEQRLGKVQVQDYRVRKVVSATGTATLGERLAALADLVAELKPEENTTWAVGMPGTRVSVRLIQLPFSDRERIEQTLPFELERFVPFDPEDFILDWRTLPAAGEGARVLCGLAHRDEVQATLEGLRAVGVDPKHLVLDADVLGVYSDTASHVQAIVDVGHDRTLVCVTHGDEVLAVRAISRGGADLTDALVTAMKVDAGAAEGHKHVTSLRASAVVQEWEGDEPTDAHLTDPAIAGLARPGKKDATAVLVHALQPWLSSLRVTLIALEDDIGHGIDEVLISGGGSAVEGLPQLLSQDLGVPVRHVKLGDEAEMAGDPDRFTLAHALAMRAAGLSTGRELHFRKEEFAFKGDLATLRSVFGLAAVAMAVFCVAGVGLFAWKTVQYNQEIAKVEASISETVKEAFPDTSDTQLQTPSLAKAIMLEKTTETLDRVEALGGTVSGEPPVLTALLQVSDSVPPHNKAVLDVNDLTINEAGITIRAETSGYEAAATIESALQSNERFANAKKGEETKKGDKLSFSVSIPFEVEEEEG
jgi:general secretion pathway protein L